METVRPGGKGCRAELVSCQGMAAGGCHGGAENCGEATALRPGWHLWPGGEAQRRAPAVRAGPEMPAWLLLDQTSVRPLKFLAIQRILYWYPLNRWD